MELLLVLFALLFGGCLQSCTAPNGLDTAAESVNFTLPVWQSDSDFPSLAYWEISTHSQKYKIPKDQNSFSLTVPKNRIVAITARPITENSFGEETVFFYPAGTVYPALTTWDGNQAKNTLTWEDGFTAKIVELIYGSAKSSGYSENTITDFVERFNWKKFSEVIYKKSASAETVFYNPWQVDLSGLMQKLISKNFNANSLNAKNIYALPVEKIPLPVCTEGKIISAYIPENKFILETQTVSVSKSKANRFLYNIDFVLIITAPNEKKVLTDTVFLPKIVREEE